MHEMKKNNEISMIASDVEQPEDTKDTIFRKNKIFKMGSEIKNKIYFAFLAFLPVFSINYYFDNGFVLLRNSIINIFIYAAVFFLIKKAYSISNKYLHKVSLFTALSSSLALTFGHSLYVKNDFSLIIGSKLSFIISVLVVLGLALLFYCTFKILFDYLIKIDSDGVGLNSRKKNTWKYFGTNKRSLFILWLLIFLLWIPCYLSYYPGMFSYDITPQAYQAIGRDSFNRFQNTAHTFFFMVCFNIGQLFGGYETGLVAYSIIQMLIMSFVFAFTVWYMAKIGTHYGLRIAALLYFALNPLNAIFSFGTTKDVIFGAFILLSTIMLVDVARNPERFFKSVLQQTGLAVMIVVTCLFRQNAIYGIFIFFFLFMFLYRRHILTIISIMILTVTSFYIIYGPVYTALGVGSGVVGEALSLPIQQISYVVTKHEDKLTVEEREAIDEILGCEMIKGNYNPRFADPTKRYFNNNKFSEDPKKYGSLWLSLLFKYPVEYFEAGLNLNLGYWYPDCVHPDEYSERVYIETNLWKTEAFSFDRKSVFPNLLEFYETFALGVEQQKIPVISLLFSIGFPIWFVFFGIMICIAKRRRKLILILLPTACVWLTFMAGPVSNMRYIYFIPVCYPLYLALTVNSRCVSSADNTIEEKAIDAEAVE